MVTFDSGRILIGASDLTAASSCQYSWLRQVDEACGRIDPVPRAADVMMRRAAELGDIHERRILDSYRAAGRTIIEIGRDGQSREEAARETLRAFREGADVVAQAAFVSADHGVGFVGYADLVVRQDDGRYRVQDVKLARTARVTALLQVAAYAGQLREAGIPTDDHVDLILGDSRVSTHRLSDIEPMYGVRRNRLVRTVLHHLENGPADWEDDQIPRCGTCSDCRQQIEDRRDLWQVYNLRGSQRVKLRALGMLTIDDLARWREGDEQGDIPSRTLAKLAAQARLQVESEGREQPLVEVRDPASLSLPEPSEGDIFFDFEGDPLWTVDGVTWGIDYLFGFVDSSGAFTSLWAHSLAEERQALLDFLDVVEERRARFPDMHVYHYASYERAHLASIAQRHGVGEERVGDLLRQGVLVDLFTTVGRALQIGTASYSIKSVEALHMAGERREGVTNAADSVDQYAHYVLLRDSGRMDEARLLLQEIADYNEYDCVSTLRLRDWLRELARTENVEPSRPATSEAALSQEDKRADRGPTDELDEAVAVISGDPFDPARTDRERAWGLAGAALLYHRRENKSFWWEHFARLTEPVDSWAEHRGVFHVTDAELIRDWSRLTARSGLSRELMMRGSWTAGSTPRDGTAFAVYDTGPSEDPLNRRTASVMMTVMDDGVRMMERHPKGFEPSEAVPIALTPGSPPHTKNLETAIESWVRSAYESGTIPEDPLGDVLMRRPSRMVDGTALAEVVGEDTVDAVVTSTLNLAGSYLAIQGPPGTGKTYVAAHTIVRLVRDWGWRVGVVAQSHKVVDNVLTEAHRYGLPGDLIIKAQSTSEKALPIPITHCDNAAGQSAILPGGCVIGGTAWLFSRLKPGSLDLLVIDEAGQFSLANTIASGTCARNLLLVGDPQQLPQVSSGTHPEPVNESALGYLIDGRDVLPSDRGYFLAESRRMDDSVAQPVSVLSYEGQLRSHTSTRRRRLEGIAPGVNPIPIHHAGNVSSSEEEAEHTVTLIQSHLGTDWFDGQQHRPLNEKDLIVVTPYNAQVDTLRQALDRAGLNAVRAGTVDKFQGQEAVIAITSLAASSAADVPRGLSFLLMRNRLNVSISRAQWLSYILYSPALLDHLPATPDALREMSAFARLVDEQ